MPLLPHQQNRSLIQNKSSLPVQTTGVDSPLNSKPGSTYPYLPFSSPLLFASLTGVPDDFQALLPPSINSTSSSSIDDDMVSFTLPTISAMSSTWVADIVPQLIPHGEKDKDAAIASRRKFFQTHPNQLHPDSEILSAISHIPNASF